MAPNDWQGQWMNRQQLLSRLAGRGRRIVYSPGQWHSWQRVDPRWRAASFRGEFREHQRVLVDYPPKWLLRVPRVPLLDEISVRWAAGRLRRAAWDNLGRPPITYIFHPTYQPYAAALRPHPLVYHAYDLFEEAPGWNGKAAAREDWLLMHADLAIASSEVAAERLAERSGRSVRFLPNGANTRAFGEARSCARVPVDLAAIQRPRIGYVGSVNRKLDLSLIAQLAVARPQWQFVLTGPVGSLDEETAAGLERCASLRNVHLLGERPHDQLPAYVAHLDVATMPYRTGPGLWTGAGYPLKLHEYLAADVPVVTTRLACLEPFSTVLAFADNFTEWEQGIRHALEEGGVGQGLRQQVATENDWDLRAEQLDAWLSEIQERAHV